MADRVGQQFGNYRLTRLLGHGGFAEVYLGEHVYLSTQAAVKILQTQLARDQKEQFRAEARTIAHLEHPHIVRVLEFGIENDIPFLVMTYAPNGTVREHYPKGTPVPLHFIVQYVQQLADALQYAHDQKLVHRDIKPENILLGRRGEILLSDFGIATLAQSSRPDMQEVVGTVSYMAPEQLQGKPRPASDQYALGIVVYEWLGGAAPFQGTFTEVASQHMFVPPPPLRDKAPTSSPELEQVVMTALAKDPQQRFANVWAFARALEQAAQPILPSIPPSAGMPMTPDLSTSSPTRPDPYPRTSANQDEAMLPTIISSRPAHTPLPPTPVGTPAPLVDTRTPPAQLSLSSRPGTTEFQPAPQGFSRRTVVMGIAGLVVAAGVGGGVVWFALSQKSGIVGAPTPTAPSAPNTPTVAPTTAPAASSPSPTPTSPPAPSLGTTLTTYRGHSSYVYGVAWVTPDGQRIASAGLDKTVQEWNAISGNKYFSYNHTNAVNDVKASRTGTLLASAGEDAVAQVRDAVTGKQLLTYSGHQGAVNTARWSPDGTHIVTSSADTTAQVWNASSGQTLITYQGHTAEVWAAAWSPDGQRIVSVGKDGTAQVWDANSGSLITVYRGHSATVRSVSWSPDGQRIATAGEDRTVQIWNSSTAAAILTYRGHTDLLRTVEWSHDGTRIVSGGRDATAQVWDANTGNTLFVYRGHTATVFDAQWSPDDMRIASGSTDTTVRIWQAR